MKLINFVCTCFCMAVVWSFASCSDEKEAPLVPLNPYEDILFDITVDESTVNSCALTVTPSADEVPYLSLYVTEDVFSRVPKEELKDYLMADLQAQADQSGQELSEFLKPFLMMGKKTIKLENLSAGTTYELVVFAIHGVTPAKRSAHQFFKTPLVDMMQCTFNVEAAQKEGVVYFNVKPSDKEQYWFFSVVDKAAYDRVVAENNATDEDIVGVLFNDALQSLKPQSMDDILNKLFEKGDQILGYKLPAETKEVVWLAILMKPINDTQVVFASNVSKGVINIQKLPTLKNSMKQNVWKSMYHFDGYLPVAHLVKP